MSKWLTSGPSGQIFRIILYGAGLSSISIMVWHYGSYVNIGGWRPFDSYVVRESVVVALTAAMAGFGGFSFWRRKKQAAALVAGIAQPEGDKKEDLDTPVLKEKMKDALATLKTASGGKAEYLYDLPWYVLIGPPGSGKTTALVNSGLKFPLSRGATPAAVAGVGGTRYCDWWFTEDAVLIDTAGRYTTQDSDAQSDKESWFSFLDLLKKNRPRQPINGVIVAISLEDLMTLSSAELSAHANAIRARLLELHERLKVDFPVYALFTKGDLVAGFSEFFANLGEEGRKQVWGATFQTNDKTRNLVGEVPYEFDTLIERLNNDLTDRLQEEPTPTARVALYGFPAQMSALKRPIFDFLNAIFEPTRYHANATLRGFYFTSGTQEGTPIDQVIGALARSFGAQEVAAAGYSGRGKSYFLTDLINKVIIGEAAWVSTDRSAVRRAFIMRTAAYAAILLLSLACAGAWWLSYSRNSTLIHNTDVSVVDYAKAAGPLPRESLIADRDFAKVLPILHRLRHLPTGYAVKDVSTPISATFGLSQRERLQSSSDSSYGLALERMFRPRLAFRMEEVLEANRNNPSFLYEALKVYLMLGGLHTADKDLIVNWMRRDWSENLYPGSANAEGRKALEEHLVAMLDLGADREPLFTLHGPLIEECQKTLARLSVAQRAYELLKSQARSSPVARDWQVTRNGGPDVALVFEGAGGKPLEDIKVPGFFTYAGFQRAFVERLGDITEQVKRDRWVLGTAGEQSAVSEQYDNLVDDLLEIYTRDFQTSWRQALGDLRLKRLTADKPKYIALSAVSAATSPLKQLFESIRDETALTRDRPGLKKDEKDDKSGKAASLPPGLMKQQDRAPGAAIEASFKHFHVMVEGDGGKKPVDQLITTLGEINQSLTLAATNPSQTAQANASLQTQVANLRASAARFPPPFNDMVRGAANEFIGDVSKATADQIMLALNEQVNPTCHQVVNGRYPFSRGSDREVPLADFGRLFGPNGVIDKFYQQYLAGITDTSKAEWTFRPDSPVGANLNRGLLRTFQRAAEIRDTFFATGGTQPSIMMSVTPPPVAPPAPPAQQTGFSFGPTPPQANAPSISVKMEVNGTLVESKPGRNSPVAVSWPGAGGRTAILVEEVPGTVGQPPSRPPSVLEKQGAWSLFRLLDSAGAQKRGDRIFANFVVGGRELTYQISVGSVHNPFNLPALREFRCPTGT